MLSKTTEAAKVSGLSKYFLYRNAHRIPAAYKAGKAVRWNIDELLEWMKSQAQGQS